MGKARDPVTRATRALRAAGVSYTGHAYKYEERGGTAVCARELGIDEHMVVKTLVMEDESGSPFLVLMHGDMNVSTRELARSMGVRSVSPCDPRDAERHTGYQVGGTSPFGTLKMLPVYMEESIMALPLIYINGGRRGFLVSMSPSDASALLRPLTVRVGRE